MRARAFKSESEKRGENEKICILGTNDLKKKLRQLKADFNAKYVLFTVKSSLFVVIMGVIWDLLKKKSPVYSFDLKAMLPA